MRGRLSRPEQDPRRIGLPLIDEAQNEVLSLIVSLPAELRPIEAFWPKLEMRYWSCSSDWPPLPGSELATDEQQWPTMPSGASTWFCLIAAQDHLRLFKHLLESETVHPIASESILRGALVAAATAAWLVLPKDGDTRHERAWLYALDCYRNRSTWSNLAQRLALDAEAFETAQREDKDRITRLRSLLKESSQTPTPDRMNLTSVIDWVAGTVFLEHPEAGHATKLLWRQLGASVHSLSWSTVVTPDSIVENQGQIGSLSKIVYSGSYSTLREGFLASFHLMEAAWRCYLCRAGYAKATRRYVAPAWLSA